MCVCVCACACDERESDNIPCIQWVEYIMYMQYNNIIIKNHMSVRF